MLNPHSLSWSEITTLVAALGMFANASVGFYLMKKSDGRQMPQALRAQARRNPANPSRRP